ncbi:MAG TPA: DUF896 domain-containing protein [Pseudogracilibacillus sp.]|nr:DUF896 domain-containing protein [Pseudogracilibacillus sp.]
MMSKEKLNRINELAKKKKSIGLTKEEQTEQNELRDEYIKNVRKSFSNQIESMTVIDPEGNDVTPEKVKEIQRKKNSH